MFTVKPGLLAGVIPEFEHEIKELEQQIETLYSIAASLKRMSVYDDILPGIYDSADKLGQQHQQMKSMAETLDDIIGCYAGSENNMVGYGIWVRKQFQITRSEP